MAKSLNKPKIDFSKRLLPLCAIGCLISAYLTHHHLEIKSNLQLGPSMCSINEIFDCDPIAKSWISEFAGIPISLWGLSFYLLFIGYLLSSRNQATQIRIKPLVLLSGISVIISLSLFLFSIIVIKKICLFCLSLYLINIVILLILLKKKPTLSPLHEFIFPLVKNPYFLAIGFGSLIFISHFSEPYIKHFLQPRYLRVFDETKLNEVLKKWEESPVLITEEQLKNIRAPIVMGARSPKITIVEFGDYECPFCKKVAPILEKTINQYSKSAQLILAQFPLDQSCNPAIQKQVHLLSCEIARAVVCGENKLNGLGIKLHKSFINSTPSSTEELNKTSEALGLNLNECESAKELLDSQIKLANDIKISSTPSIFVNGKKLDYQSFYQIEPLLNRIIIEKR